MTSTSSKERTFFIFFSPYDINLYKEERKGDLGDKKAARFEDTKTSRCLSQRKIAFVPSQTGRGHAVSSIDPGANAPAKRP
jgi:hypothetical protein